MSRITRNAPIVKTASAKKRLFPKTTTTVRTVIATKTAKKKK